MRNYYFAKDNKKIEEKMKKESFVLSEIILDKRYELGLTFEETAKILGLTEQEYLDYEYGEDYISIDDYNNAIDILNRRIEKSLSADEQYNFHEVTNEKYDYKKLIDSSMIFIKNSHAFNRELLINERVDFERKFNLKYSTNNDLKTIFKSKGNREYEVEKCLQLA